MAFDSFKVAPVSPPALSDWIGVQDDEPRGCAAK
jgi:hypothetical protein